MTNQRSQGVIAPLFSPVKCTNYIRQNDYQNESKIMAAKEINKQHMHNSEENCACDV